MGRASTDRDGTRRGMAVAIRDLRRWLMATPAMTSWSRGFHRTRMRVRRQIWPPTLQFLGGVIVVLLAIGFGLTYIVGSPWWHESNTLCDTSSVGCGLAIHLLGTGIVAVIAFYVFFLGRETLVPRVGAAMPLWRERLFVAMYRNAGSVARYFNLPPNRVVELGSQIVL